MLIIRVLAQSGTQEVIRTNQGIAGDTKAGSWDGPLFTAVGEPDYPGAEGVRAVLAEAGPPERGPVGARAT